MAPSKDNKKLKAGIIGLGVGEKHIAGYSSHPDCEVVALCDFAEEKQKICKEKHPKMEITGNADDILENPDIDIVSIASYDNFHYEQIIKALNNEKHVFVEKPLCLYEHEAIEIKSRLSEKKNLRLSSNLILRLTPRFIKLKDMIQEGYFGEIFYFESDYNYGRIHKLIDGWRGEIDFYSIVYGGGVHIVDLLLWLSDEMVEEVTAFGNDISTRNTRFKYNDLVVALLRFKSGRVAKIACNFGCVFPHFHTLSVFGTKATFVNDFDQGLLYESRDSRNPTGAMKEAYPGTEKGDLIHSFIETIINGTEPAVSEGSVFRTMSVCFAIEKAVSSSSSVKVKYI